MRKQKKLQAVIVAVLGILVLGAGSVEAKAEVTLYPIAGTVGANESEGPGNLFDGDETTKWCVTGFDEKESVHMFWAMSEPLTLSGFYLVTGNDNSKHLGRNPSKWSVYGSNGDDYADISSYEKICFTNAELEDEDYKRHEWTVNELGDKYKRFMLVIEETSGADVMQLSEFHPVYEGVDDYEVDYMGVELLELLQNSTDSSSQNRSDSSGGSSIDWNRDDDRDNDRKIKCTKCFGSGEIDCTACGGDGGKYVYDNSTPNYSGSTFGSRSSKTWENCYKCGGTGEQTCTRCGGSGEQ